jgi:hypothetical protein
MTVNELGSMLREEVLGYFKVLLTTFSWRASEKP